MTSRKLTPAEALAFFREWKDDRMDYESWKRRWPSIRTTISAFADIAIAALEEALAQKPPAGKVKPVYAPCGRRFTLESAVWHGGDEDGAGMPSEVVVYGSGDMGAGEVATYRKVQVGETQKPPAAPAVEQAIAAKDAWERAWDDHVQWMAKLEARDKALLERIKAIRPTEPAAPVPSDKEIESAIHRWRLFELGHDKLTAMEDALRMLARRIGVQGLPQ